MEKQKITWKKRLAKINQKKYWYVLLEYLIVGAIFYAIFQFLVGVAPISGNSMYPTLNDGDYAFYTRMDRNFYKGDIVIINVNNTDLYIKRIVATPGDTVDIMDDKLYINGRAEKENFLFNSKTQAVVDGVTFPITLNPGEYFVLGDNRESSDDSRHFGPVDISQIQGKLQYYLGGLF